MMSNVSYINSTKRKGGNDMDTTRNDGGDGGSLGPRVARLESDVIQIKIELTKLTTRSEEFATKGDLHKEISAQTKWLAATIIGTAGLALAVARYLFG
ncbi:hypothetical protein [Photorhabdus asymbiotica]|uniref:Hemolysin XhlA n=2 Tax=Photorhabdus asymbiotica TaxID=291112 RepID=B6VKE0_PHOAA|nr:hypothetical protein [Photorhabdus asymbiotica]CAQ83295.1 conserved hypothetical protein [Photorhabdus asymbiotica]CAR66620.1 Conserved Hypothetical Protein [Photorhabdus asymbiotica subsp. asymbiotica ATCC 43949]